MASVKYSGFITELKGSIGGTTFQSSGSGFSVRTKPHPRNRRSALQSRNRITMANLSQMWRDLSDSQRASWSAVAPDWPAVNRYGDPVLLSGFDVFMRANRGLIFIQESPVLSGVMPAAVPVPTGLEAVINATSNAATVSWTSGAIASDTLLNIRASRMLSAGRAYQPTGFVSIARIAAAVTSPQSVWDALVQRLGQIPIVGARVWFEAVVYSTLSGNSSAPVAFSAVVQEGL